MRSDDRFGQELRPFIVLLRWSGLRIGDALVVEKNKLDGNRLTAKIQKTGKTLKLIVPNEVCVLLLGLALKPSVSTRFFFWSGRSLQKSLTSQWQRKLKRLNRYLSIVDYEGKPMIFHSHQLRDTFAVEHLLAETSMQDLSLMLGHASIKVTEKYYAPWVPERQVALEVKMTDALQAMGAQVSIGTDTAVGAL